ncbi:MAG: hypothetical protein ACRCW3_03435, partial [Metamycoplasmataceae bacterium]
RLMMIDAFCNKKCIKIFLLLNLGNEKPLERPQERWNYFCLLCLRDFTHKNSLSFFLSSFTNLRERQPEFDFYYDLCICLNFSYELSMNDKKGEIVVEKFNHRRKLIVIIMHKSVLNTYFPYMKEYYAYREA